MKRKTKTQREQEQRQALLIRITDIYSGAIGAPWTEDDFATAELLSRVIPVLEALFSTETNGYLFKPHCLSYYDTAQSATQRLFESGMRA